MNEKLLQKLVQEIGTLRVELMHRDTIIEELREQIQEQQSQEQNGEEIQEIQ